MVGTHCCAILGLSGHLTDGCRFFGFILGECVEIATLVTITRERWKVALATFLVVMLCGLGFISLVTPTYKATTRIFVTPSLANRNDPTGSLLRFVQDQAKSYPGLATSPAVLQGAITTLGLPTTTAKLAKKVEVTMLTDMMWLDIAASSDSETQAQAISAEVARRLIQEVNRLNEQAGIAQLSRLTIVGTPGDATDRSGPSRILLIAASGLAALLLGLAGALLRHALDQRIRNTAFAARRLAPWYRGHLSGTTGANPSARELREARHAWFNIESNGSFDPERPVFIFSTVDGPGSALVSLRLAQAAGESRGRDKVAVMETPQDDSLPPARLFEAAMRPLKAGRGVTPGRLGEVMVLTADSYPWVDSTDSDLQPDGKVATKRPLANTSDECVIFVHAPDGGDPLAADEFLRRCGQCVIVAPLRQATTTDVDKAKDRAISLHSAVLGVVTADDR